MLHLLSWGTHRGGESLGTAFLSDFKSTRDDFFRSVNEILPFLLNANCLSDFGLQI